MLFFFLLAAASSGELDVVREDEGLVAEVQYVEAKVVAEDVDDWDGELLEMVVGLLLMEVVLALLLADEVVVVLLLMDEVVWCCCSWKRRRKFTPTAR